MPEWVVNLLLFEGGTFLVSMACCFVAGVVSKASEIAHEERKRKKEERDRRIKAMFTKRLRKSGPTSAQNVIAEMYISGDITTEEAATALHTMRSLMDAPSDGSVMRTFDTCEETVFYADNVQYMTICHTTEKPVVPEPYGTTERG